MLRPGISDRRGGSTFLLLLVPVTLLLALAAGMTAATAVGSRATTESYRRMRAFYLADSGAQAGNALVRSEGSGIGEVAFEEKLAGDTALVRIAPIASDTYQITSTGIFHDTRETVELQVRFITEEVAFALQGAIQVSVEPGVEVGGRLRVLLTGSSLVSGMDHSESGELLGDQREAVYGLAVDPLPGDLEPQIEVSEPAVIEGYPLPSTNEAESQAALLKALREYAREHADTLISGSTTLGSSSSHLFGTPESPKVTFVELEDDGHLLLQESFTGYGTLVVEVGRATQDAVLRLHDAAAWHGLVLVYFKDEAEVAGGELVRLQQDSRLIGGLAMYFSGDAVEIEGSGKIVHTTGDARILFSSDTVAKTAGIDQFVRTKETTRVVSYRLW